MIPRVAIPPAARVGPAPPRRVPARALLAALVALGTACAPARRAPVDARVAPEIAAALEALPAARVVSLGPAAVPRFVIGDLGEGPDLARLAPLFGIGAAQLELMRAWTDRLGDGHARYRETAFGLEVVGGEVAIHVDPAGRVYAVSGTAAPVPAAPVPRISAEAARAAVAAWAGRAPGPARLCYEVGSDTGVARLAWEVALGDAGAPGAARIYLDAATGAWLDVHPRTPGALARRIYDRHTGVPVLARAEGDPATGDRDVDAAYANAGAAWACYRALFGRDSVDDAGAPVVSVVHDLLAYDGAFYDLDHDLIHLGDGDGVLFADLALAYDVTVHELTHGVEAHTAGLVFQNAPGALAEGFADLLAATCEAWRDGGVGPGTWEMGETVYTPQIPGDAVRYLDDPARDGLSADTWPDRYQGPFDQGGVHENAGIVSLAYVLTVQGGVHPRGATDVAVPPIGLARARDTYYRALTVYLSPDSDFQDARAATVQAATDLYDADTARAVDLGWQAVAVPTAAGGEDAVALAVGVPVNGLEAPAGAARRFFLAVPPGATEVRVRLKGGRGDADLYLRQGAEPTVEAWDARARSPGNEEAVDLGDAVAGPWYVMVFADHAFEGVTLEATWAPRVLTAPPRPTLPPLAPPTPPP